VFSMWSARTSYLEDKLAVEGWQFSRALQGRLRRDGAIVELTVDKSSVEGYSPNSNDVSPRN
jgi:hypothetical protein